MRNEILKIIKDVAKIKKININLNDTALDIPFKDLGIDSISVLNIIVVIEDKLRARLDDTILMKIKTINQLIKAFEEIKK